ncbi:MAG: hemerythrin domain-containing protein [Syntrophorhabdus sp.]
MKRILATCLAIILVTGLFSLVSHAASGNAIAAQKQGDMQAAKPGDELFQLLRQDHQRIRQIFIQNKGAPGEVSPSPGELLRELRAELVPHMIAEEKTLYAEMYKKDSTREMAKQTVKEHQDIKRVMNELQNMRDDEVNSSPRISELRQLVNNHVRNEETMLFRSARDNLDPNILNSLAARFQQEKRNAMK